MTVVRAARTFGFADRINVQHNLRDLFPTGAGLLCIEKAEISDEVLLIIARQDGIGRSHVSDIGIERGKGHRSETHKGKHNVLGRQQKEQLYTRWGLGTISQCNQSLGAEL